MFGLMPCDQCSSHSEYASKWMKMKQEAFSLASKTKEIKLSKVLVDEVESGAKETSKEGSKHEREEGKAI